MAPVSECIVEPIADRTALTTIAQSGNWGYRYRGGLVNFKVQFYRGPASEEDYESVVRADLLVDEVSGNDLLNLLKASGVPDDFPMADYAGRLLVSLPDESAKESIQIGFYADIEWKVTRDGEQQTHSGPWIVSPHPVREIFPESFFGADGSLRSDLHRIVDEPSVVRLRVGEPKVVGRRIFSQVRNDGMLDTVVVVVSACQISHEQFDHENYWPGIQ